jgi:hypothetical protein
MLRYNSQHYSTQHYSTLQYTKLHYTTLHHTTLITPHHNRNYNYTTLVTLHYSYNSATLQLQLQLRCTMLHPASVGEVTTAPIATTPKNTTPPSFHQRIRSAIHASQHLTSPIVSYPWNFRRRLVRYYWYEGFVFYWLAIWIKLTPHSDDRFMKNALISRAGYFGVFITAWSPSRLYY